MAMTTLTNNYIAIPTNATKSGLKAAQIIEVGDNRKPVGNGVRVSCMFNPFEYSVSKSNSFEEKQSTNGGGRPEVEFSKAGAQTLKLSLLFDTYGDTDEGDKDVRQETDKLWQLMQVKAPPTNDRNQKQRPPLVAFHWGTFYFISYITEMSQKFTLFSKDGVPVRARVDVTFTQYVDQDDYPPQNPTSGGGPIDRVWQVTGGDRIDNIAAEVYGDATQWRLIARYNQLVDPLALRPGQQLLIPFIQDVEALA
jgi:hypothetical protein